MFQQPANSTAKTTTGTVVPFGKYKDQPVEVLAADTGYLEWLMSQPWVRERYPSFYNIVINYGGEPQDSPEHNQMQAAFLDDARCLLLAAALRPRWSGYPGVIWRQADSDPMLQKFSECYSLEKEDVYVYGRVFEDQGWDVKFRLSSAGINVNLERLVPPLPACTCQCDHSECSLDAKCHEGARWCRHENHKKSRVYLSANDHCTESCYWKTLDDKERQWLRLEHSYSGPDYTARVELKPDLGDDYPSVLRQVTKYPFGHNDARCVLVRRHSFTYVTWEQVQQIFKASNIRLLAESDLPPIEDLPATG